MLIILWDLKEPTHYSYKSRVIPVLSFVCEWGVGEVGHLVRDLGVLLCPFPLGNKSCPVKWTKSKSKPQHFQNGPNWPPCKGLSKIVTLGQKLKLSKTCKKLLYNHITVVGFKKQLEQTPIYRKVTTFPKWRKISSIQSL